MDGINQPEREARPQDGRAAQRLEGLLVDFNDLLLLTHRLFETNPGVLARWQERAAHLHVPLDNEASGQVVERHRNRLDLTPRSGMIYVRCSESSNPR